MSIEIKAMLAAHQTLLTVLLADYAGSKQNPNQQFTKLIDAAQGLIDVSHFEDVEAAAIKREVKGLIRHIAATTSIQKI